MRYNQAQIDAVVKELRRKYINVEAESHEIAVSLIVMVKTGRISVEEMQCMLLAVFFNNAKGAIQALKKAEMLIDEEMITDIINGKEGQQ